MYRLQNKYIKNDDIFLSVYIKKRRRSGATLRIFDECNQENRQVIWYTYLRNDALDFFSYMYIVKPV